MAGVPLDAPQTAKGWKELMVALGKHAPSRLASVNAAGRALAALASTQKGKG